MPVWQAVVLGIVQGLGEFLPISSSAHLILVPWALNWEDPGLAFDVALHWGTLFGVLAVFWKDWIALIRAGLASLLERRIGGDPERRLFWALVISSVPAAIIGKLLHEWAEDRLRNPLLIAGTLTVMGLLLWVADRAGHKNREMEGSSMDPHAAQAPPSGRAEPLPARAGSGMGLGEALAIGVAQACALVPGVSRSGATISLGLGLGFTREAIARFSFLMSTPIILGAGLLKLPALLKGLRGHTPPGEVVVGPAALLAGMAAAAIVGVIVIRWLLQFLRTNGYGVFAVYRVLLAVGVLALYFARGH